MHPYNLHASPTPCIILVQLEEKLKIAMAPGTAFRGYQALGANVTRYEGGFQRDHHEAIDLYKEAASMVRVLHKPCACLPL